MLFTKGIISSKKILKNKDNLETKITEKLLQNYNDLKISDNMVVSEGPRKVDTFEIVSTLQNSPKNNSLQSTSFESLQKRIVTSEPRREDIENNGNNLILPDFKNISVSTKTFIIQTNMILNIKSLFEELPISEYIVIPKRRGRKKKSENVDINNNLLCGSIITLKYFDEVRGILLKKKKKNNSNKKRGSYFRNSITIVMIIDVKKINFKISRNGKFQMTGCKFDSQAHKCVKFIWDYIKDKPHIYTLGYHSLVPLPLNINNNSNSIVPLNLEAIFIPVMRNIDFGVGFFIDREKLDEYINLFTDYHSLLETSFGYTGVNIKVPIKKSITELPIEKLIFDHNLQSWSDTIILSYGDYLKTLPEKERIKKLEQIRYNTFLVFHSGKLIMSGIHEIFQNETFDEFIQIIRDSYDIIEERLVLPDGSYKKTPLILPNKIVLDPLVDAENKKLEVPTEKYCKYLPKNNFNNTETLGNSHVF
jgi:TATA-box binding protein (TBP) (component of TFIID and TFIIIB)